MIARSIREASALKQVGSLVLRASEDLVCKNMLCEKVGEACICRLDLVLSRMPQLKELDLSSNQLPALPVSMSRLSEMTTLNLQHNKLTALPEWIKDLPSLQKIDVSHNPLNADDEVLQQLRQRSGVTIVSDTSPQALS